MRAAAFHAEEVEIYDEGFLIDPLSTDNVFIRPRQGTFNIWSVFTDYTRRDPLDRLLSRVAMTVLDIASEPP
jgi:hypothetical protein